MQQERAMREMQGERGSGRNAPPMQPPPAPPAGLGLEQSRRGGVSIGMFSRISFTAVPGVALSLLHRMPCDHRTKNAG